jgi:hypothetical protein
LLSFTRRRPPELREEGWSALAIRTRESHTLHLHSCHEPRRSMSVLTWACRDVNAASQNLIRCIEQEPRD